MNKVNRFHIVPLSNFLKGYNKYLRTYSKESILESTYPNEFYLLKKEELEIGFEKVNKLLKKINLEGNQPIIIETLVDSIELNPNLRNGKGEFINQNWIRVERIYYRVSENLIETHIEEVVARAYKLFPIASTYEKIKPRTISILPIAIGCQASCHFCFSDSSISSDQKNGVLQQEDIERVLIKAKVNGAERAVITGGGEPGMLQIEELLNLISLCSKYFSKTVLITNGYFLTKSPDAGKRLERLSEAGLTTLAVSRHHYDPKVNKSLMGIEIPIENLFSHVKPHGIAIEMRLICVLQKGGISTESDIKRYVDWGIDNEVNSICFKELYVSSSAESIYYSKTSNDYCRINQVSLNILLELAAKEKWIKLNELPWGSPIYLYPNKNGSPLTIAAYTEPSVSWELSNGICRSWNLMTNGDCFASLETRESKILI